MSIRVMNRVWDRSAQKGNALLLLIKLADNANDDGYAWPGTKYLMKHTRISSRETLHTNLLRLEVAGEIITESGGGNNGTNSYFVCCGMELPEVDARRKAMGLPTRDEIAERLERYTSRGISDEDTENDPENTSENGPEMDDFDDEKAEGGVRKSYTLENPEGVRNPYRGCTDFGQGCTDFRGGCTESVHKPSLTIKQPSVNQLKGAVQKKSKTESLEIPSYFVRMKENLFEQLGKYNRFIPYVEALQFDHQEGQTIYLTAGDPELVEARFGSTIRNLFAGLTGQVFEVVIYQVDMAEVAV